MKPGIEKIVYRLIVMFLSTEIFSKRRKIYAWVEEKTELLPSCKGLLHILKLPY